MKKIALIALSAVFGQVLIAESMEFPYPWIDVQTDNYGWSWSEKGGLVGYVIDDQSRSNLPSSMRFYQGEMIFEFEDVAGVFVMNYKVVDYNYHYDETVTIRASTDGEVETCTLHDWGAGYPTKGVSISFKRSGRHKIVIHGVYHRIFSQNGATRGCVTTFTNIAWHPNTIRVQKQGSTFDVACDWLAQYNTFEKSPVCASDYQDIALSVGKNGCMLAESFVAGLDPTDPKSTFRTMIGFEDGKPVVSWDPALNGKDENGRCKKTGVRTYRVLGSTDLKTWSEVIDGEESKYNFFKVNVEMP